MNPHRQKIFSSIFVFCLSLLATQECFAQCAPYIVQEMQFKGVPPWQIMQLCGPSAGQPNFQSSPNNGFAGALSQMCMTPQGNCLLPGPAPRGAPCGCATPYGGIQGMVQ